jgi:hypothetical protein
MCAVAKPELGEDVCDVAAAPAEMARTSPRSHTRVTVFAVDGDRIVGITGFARRPDLLGRRPPATVTG